MSPRFQAALARFQRDGADPLVSVQLLVEGMLTLEEDADLAEQLMCIVVSKKRLLAARTLSGFRFTRNGYIGRLQRDPHIARSFLGATWQGNYQDFDPRSGRVEVDAHYSPRTQGVGYPREGQAKFFLVCGGADRPRPVTLARNNMGLWKIIEWSSLTVGVRPPASSVGDF